ncbi:hypothetical protein BKA82DRAFT_515119 [Pisolithus tinctorius]|uniref:Uncharacterized protein n=1 Tax=Pisolithus tinctorius Marx 270 TaxID=870435 RepID=A0A0C3I8D7_PISTI|nr:hypothetical protein BKA82DRAFT_515119 [Pisolithus tinctorius]KIN93357.1 hypothetical protein M404DRAFT_515119 [Pisolithus tinctorius Marx 270]
MVRMLPPPAITPLTLYECKCKRVGVNMVRMLPPPVITPLTSYEPQATAILVSTESVFS